MRQHDRIKKLNEFKRSSLGVRKLRRRLALRRHRALHVDDHRAEVRADEPGHKTAALLADRKSSSMLVAATRKRPGMIRRALGWIRGNR